MKRGIEISELLRPLSEATSQAYLSNALQFADILDWVLAQVGKSEVWISTFSVSEEFLRRLFHIKRTREISNLNVVLDHKATNKTISLWVLLSNLVDNAYLSNNHSKLLLVRAESGECVSVVTSQNLTRGNRSESAFVCTDPGVYCTLLEQYENLVKNNSISLHELLGRTTERNRTSCGPVSENN